MADGQRHALRVAFTKGNQTHLLCTISNLLTWGRPYLYFPLLKTKSSNLRHFAFVPFHIARVNLKVFKFWLKKSWVFSWRQTAKTNFAKFNGLVRVFRDPSMGPNTELIVACLNTQTQQIMKNYCRFYSLPAHSKTCHIYIQHCLTIDFLLSSVPSAFLIQRLLFAVKSAL